MLGEVLSFREVALGMGKFENIKYRLFAGGFDCIEGSFGIGGEETEVERLTFLWTLHLIILSFACIKIL